MTIGRVLRIFAEKPFRSPIPGRWRVRRLADELSNTYGIGYPIPVEIEIPLAYVRLIVDNPSANFVLWGGVMPESSAD